MRLSTLALDVRFAVRQLRRAPGFAAVVVATLALGVGVNSAVFALADAALLRPLPFRAPDRLVLAWERRGATGTTMPSPAEFHAWSQRARSFEAISALAAGGTSTMAGPDGLAVLVPSMAVDARFFEVLGVTPLLGRTFQDGDTAASTALVLSEKMWRERFNADSAIVGRAVVLGGRAMTVIGVVPARVQVVPPFTFGATTSVPPPDVFTVASFETAGADRAHFVHVIGRLRTGVSLEAAQRDVEAIAADLARESTAQAGHGVLVQPLRDALIGGEVRRTALVLLGVVGFLLVMGCANLANLLLARASDRAREFAVRSAVGAARRRIVVQLLTESLTLAVVGGVAAVVVANGLLRGAVVLMPPGLLPNALRIPFDGRAALLCAAVTVAVGALVGLAGAWPATGASIVRATGSRTLGRGRSRWLSGALIGVQVAAGVLVVSGSGLLLRTWSALGHVDAGYRARDLFTATVTLPFPAAPGARYADGAAVRRFQEAVERELMHEPTVRDVAWGSALPLDGGWFAQPIHVAGDASRPDGPAQTAAYHMVTPSYFAALGVTIVRGRAFTRLDASGSIPVCIVSEAFVRGYLGDRDPLGVRVEVPLMAFGSPPVVTRAIVGVVRQVKSTPDEVAPVPQLYVPLEQNAWWSASLLVVPRQGRAETLEPVVRAALARVDPALALRQPRTMARVAADATARPRFRAWLVSAFGALGVVLAMVGIFGVLAHAVGQRRRELGIRMALGARRHQVVAIVGMPIARSVGAGTLAGLGLTALLARSMTTFLFQVEPLDPITLVGAAIVLGVTAIAAAVVPSLRAVRVDPVTAFRSE